MRWYTDGEYIEDKAGNSIARIMGSAPYNVRWSSLIAAAPELLESCKLLAARYDSLTTYDHVVCRDDLLGVAIPLDIVKAILAAVAKAEGAEIAKSR